MIYLELFLGFLKVGCFTFGGGYGAIPLIRDVVLSYGWLDEEMLTYMIAVSESTPGPFAINMATFIGSNQAGILGSALATLGVVLPSFIIILLISSVIKNFLKYKAVDAFLSGVRPVVVGLITGTAITMLCSNLLGLSLTDLKLNFTPDIFGIIIFAILMTISIVYKKAKHRAPSPIIMILISAALGMLLYPLDKT